jgi:hypothetical protein
VVDVAVVDGAVVVDVAVVEGVVVDVAVVMVDGGAGSTSSPPAHAVRPNTAAMNRGNSRHSDHMRLT